MGFSIIGTGSAVPETIIPNSKLSEILDTSDEWISTRTGIKERHILNRESLEDICVLAGLRAIEDAKIDPMRLDYIICPTLGGDTITPSLSSQLQKRLHTRAICLDINAACSGFVYALDVADSYFKAKKANNILVLAGEALSRVVDWTDRASCVLFGDGAGAVVLSSEGENLLELHLTTDGDRSMLFAESRGGNCPFSEIKGGSGFIAMNGQEVYKFAVSSIERDIKKSLEDSSLEASEISYYLLHQANMRIIATARQKLGQPEEKFPMNISRYGNTSSATIPILLDELARDGKIKKGDILLFSAFGAGLTTGTCVIKWSK